jgi:uncharacterized membrane protein YhfC
MAGIFEETARFISFKILRSKYAGIGVGLSYGIGHGGIEAIIIGGLSAISSAAVALMVNAGNIETVTGALQGEALEQANAQINAIATTASYMFLISGIERALAVSMQISFSVIVFYAVYKKIWLFPAAILLHAIVDIPAAAMQVGLINNVFLVEFFVFISAILSVIIAKYAHKKLKDAAQT